MNCVPGSILTDTDLECVLRHRDLDLVIVEGQECIEVKKDRQGTQSLPPAQLAEPETMTKLEYSDQIQIKCQVYSLNTFHSSG